MRIPRFIPLPPKAPFCEACGHHHKEDQPHRFWLNKAKKPVVSKIKPQQKVTAAPLPPTDTPTIQAVYYNLLAKGQIKRQKRAKERKRAVYVRVYAKRLEAAQFALEKLGVAIEKRLLRIERKWHRVATAELSGAIEHGPAMKGGGNDNDEH